MHGDSPSVDLEALAGVLKALADPTRLRIFHTLMEGVQCNCELGESLNMAPNLISHHLRVLREAELVDAARDPVDARWIYYSVNPATLEAFNAACRRYLAVERIKPRRPTCGPSSALAPAARLADSIPLNLPTRTSNPGDNPMPKTRVLFVCIHNSARSQMAEAWLNTLFGEFFVAQSAGLEPGTLNPLVVRALLEEGIDISQKETRDVFSVYKAGKLYDYVITVCDQEAAERCPVFPGVTQRIHWSFADPSRVQGSDEEKLAQVRAIRDQIRAQIEEWAPTVIEAARSS